MSINENKTFEESVKRLDEIVNILDGGDTTLDKALELFAEGTSLVSKCNGMLDEAELKVKKLTFGMNGEAAEEDFIGKEDGGGNV